MFKTYIIASGGWTMDDERKTAILVTSVGAMSQRTYRELPQPATPIGHTAGTASTSSTSNSPASSVSTAYDTAVRTLQTFFMPTINKTAERFVFRFRAQMFNEAIQEYVAVLRALQPTVN